MKKEGQAERVNIRWCDDTPDGYDIAMRLVNKNKVGVPADNTDLKPYSISAERFAPINWSPRPYSENLVLMEIYDNDTEKSFVPASELFTISSGIRTASFDSIGSLGMRNFAAAVMDIMKVVLGLGDEYLLCQPNTEFGAFLMDEIMLGGNFGHYDERNRVVFSGNTNGVHRVLIGLKRNMRFFRFGISEILCSPLWRLWHWWWRKRHGLV